jgi:hypothetical protein
MKLNKSILITSLVFIAAAALYRLVPNRPLGFAPQIAMALFAGSLIRSRAFAFAVPLLSMFISDLLFEVLFAAGLTSYNGFYDGQILNYLLLTSLTLFGFFLRNQKTTGIIAASFAAPTTYFILSNLLVWIGGGGYGHPKTFDGLILTYIDGIPFYQGSLYATIIFSAVFFGGYRLVQSFTLKSLKSN